MSRPPLSIVIFDLGGVLIDWNPRHLYRKLFRGDDEAMEHFLATVCTDEWNLMQDAGRPFAQAVAELQVAHPAHADLIDAYHSRWPEMLAGPIPGTVEILRELREDGVRLYALTNWSAETYPLAQSHFPFLDWFRGVVVSGHERVAKPDPRIFAILLERYGIEPGGAVYVDDNPRNVEAARTTGLHAIRFTSAAALRAELEALGVLRPAVHQK